MNNVAISGIISGNKILRKDVHNQEATCEFKLLVKGNRTPIVCKAYGALAYRIQNSCIEGDRLELLGRLCWNEKNYYIAVALAELIDKELPPLVVKKEEVAQQVERFKENVDCKKAVNMVACLCSGLIDESEIEDKASELARCILTAASKNETLSQNVAHVDRESFSKLLAQMYTKVDGRYRERCDIQFLDKYVERWLSNQNAT